MPTPDPHHPIITDARISAATLSALNHHLKADRTHAKILADLADLKHEIDANLLPHAAQTLRRDTRGYGDSIVRYIDHVTIARAKFEKSFWEIGDNITNLCAGNGWQNNEATRQLWMAFTHTVQSLRQNPYKGPASVVVSSNNRLQSFIAANFLPEGMTVSPRTLSRIIAAKNRREINLCSERGVWVKQLAQSDLGQHLFDLSHPASAVRTPSLKRIRTHMTAFHRNLVTLAEQRKPFTGSAYFITAHHCRKCAEFIHASGAAAAFFDADSDNTHLSAGRLKGLALSINLLNQAGILRAPVPRQLGL